VSFADLLRSAAQAIATLVEAVGIVVAQDARMTETAATRFSNPLASQEL